MHIMAGGPIILFDAQCVLCCANAQFVLRHDKAGAFRLAPMQGEIGSALYREQGIDPRHPISILLIEGTRIRRDSDAVLAIYEGLGFPWRLATALRVVSPFLRDRVYRWVARHRYRLFGKRATCWVPPPHFRDRLL